ncbi:hypothetical protein HPB47_014129 [Ixodes persulcatus]|uniref:Uncharacterized protein n=1 Tax=Ixodes persulcatus TaxID=34615 RepID=A0AC60R0T1_IXOPE|nr:hypothetical protein HPB47_014129 [Ixodes persulcatus]
MSLIGPKTYALLKFLTAPERQSSKSFEEFRQLLRNHLSPKPSVIGERPKFHRRSQTEDEPISEFVAEIRRLAQTREFGNLMSHSETALSAASDEQISSGTFSYCVNTPQGVFQCGQYKDHIVRVPPEEDISTPLGPFRESEGPPTTVEGLITEATNIERALQARAAHYHRAPGVAAFSSSSCSTTDIREKIRDLVREEIKRLLPAAASPASPSIAEIVSKQVYQALQPEDLVSTTP